MRIAPEDTKGSNNTNKLSPQELRNGQSLVCCCSNNTNKLSPQEPLVLLRRCCPRSNNTNKLSPQELVVDVGRYIRVQIIQINLVLKNRKNCTALIVSVQIIQINLVLKNCRPYYSIIVLYLQYILSISIIKR